MDKKIFSEIETPVPLIDQDVLKTNVRDMADLSKKANLNLRPHIKSHKITEIAKIQLEHSKGITVATVHEAMVFFRAGVKDIRIARPVAGSVSLEKLVELNASAKISIIVDTLEGVLALKSIGARISDPLDVLLKVNTGLNRCGVEPRSENGVEIIRTILRYPFLRFRGLLTHAGHVYGAASKGEVKKIGREEGEILVDYAEYLKNRDILVEEVSVGATPTVYHSAFVPGVTEIRPGNYVFFDAMQISLGVAPLEKCSLSILSTVISRPAPNRIIIDAGSKALGLDKGAHGTGFLEGYGVITDPESRKKIPGLVLSRLSEEHGIIEAPKDSPLKIGDIIRIVPNHACSAINMYSHSLVLEKGKITDRWELAARR